MANKEPLQKLPLLFSINEDPNKYKEYSTNVEDIREFIVDHLDYILIDSSLCLLEYFAEKGYYSRDLDYTIRDLDYTIRAFGPLDIGPESMEKLMKKLADDLDRIRYLGETIIPLTPQQALLNILTGSKLSKKTNNTTIDTSETK